MFPFQRWIPDSASRFLSCVLPPKVDARRQEARRLPGTVRGLRSLTLSAFCLAALTGCTETSPAGAQSEPQTAPPQPASGAAPAAATTGQPPSGVTRRRDEVWVDADGRRWFGNIPFDVFFEEPYAIAANKSPVAGSESTLTAAGASDAVTPEMSEEPEDSPAATTVADTVPAGTPDTTAAQVSGAFSWDQLIDAQTLDDEVKSIRNFFNENLQTVGNYNSAMLMIPSRAATMAALAGIAAEHPGEITWKEDAAWVRDLAAKMNSDALQRGAKDQRRLLELYEGISDTLNRSPPADLEDPAPVESLAEVAEMRLLMMRMSAAEQQMRTEAGTEGSFTANQAMVLHEAAVLGTLSHTVTSAGYGYEDDPKFVGYGQEVVNAAKSIVSAAQAGDFATYEVSLSRISTICQACHSQYKND